MRPALRWTGVVFGFAVLLLLVTVADSIGARLGMTPGERFGAALVAAAVAGVLTASYSGVRGGMHSFLGAVLGGVVLTFVVFGGAWQPAVYTAAACTLAGAVTEIVLRQRGRA